MAALAASRGALGCAVGTWASPGALAVGCTFCCTSGTARPTGALLGAGAVCTLAVDDVAALAGASTCTGATGFPLAGACLAIDASAITASATAFVALSDTTGPCAVAAAALASAGRGIIISFDGRGIIISFGTRIANDAVAGSPAIPRTAIGAPSADAGASLGARSALVGAAAWLVASGAYVAVAAGLALGALACASVANAKERNVKANNTDAMAVLSC